MATKRDFTQVAHDVFMQATKQAPAKNAPSAKQLAGRAGGLVGGKQRMASMSAEERARLSALGVAARKTPASSDAGAVKVTNNGR